MYKEKTCEICGAKFIPTSPTQKICGSAECQKQKEKHNAQKYKGRYNEYRREYLKEYRKIEKVKEQNAAYDKKYQIEHKEQIRDYKKVWFQKQQFLKYLKKGVLLKSTHWYSLSKKEKEEILLNNKYLKIGTSDKFRGRIYVEDKIMNLAYEIEEIHRHEEEEKNIAYFLTKKYKPLLYEYYEKLNNSEDDSEIIDYCEKYIDIFNEVSSYYKEGEDNSALYELFEILDKNIVPIWCKLGLTFYNMKEYETALEMFEYALGFKVKELEANIYFYIGSCYFDLENYSNAYENCKKAYELDKDNLEAKKLANLAFAKLVTPYA